jgi:hypothetical protein
MERNRLEAGAGARTAVVTLTLLICSATSGVFRVSDSPTFAAGGAAALGGGSGCNNCEEREKTTCPEGCHVTEHAFGPLPGCWPGQDCKRCLEGEHSGCHSGYELGYCETSHPSSCDDSFAALKQEAEIRIARGDVAFLKQIIRDGAPFDATRNQVELRSDCDNTLVAFLIVPEPLAQQVARSARG